MLVLLSKQFYFRDADLVTQDDFFEAYPQEPCQLQC